MENATGSRAGSGVMGDEGDECFPKRDRDRKVGQSMHIAHEMHCTIAQKGQVVCKTNSNIICVSGASTLAARVPQLTNQNNGQRRDRTDDLGVTEMTILAPRSNQLS